MLRASTLKMAACSPEPQNPYSRLYDVTAHKTILYICTVTKFGSCKEDLLTTDSKSDVEWTRQASCGHYSKRHVLAVGMTPPAPAMLLKACCLHYSSPCHGTLPLAQLPLAGLQASAGLKPSRAHRAVITSCSLYLAFSHLATSIRRRRLYRRMSFWRKQD
jgi:hypothetical protein